MRKKPELIKTLEFGANPTDLMLEINWQKSTGW
jgi:hypothetical protein